MESSNIPDLEEVNGDILVVDDDKNSRDMLKDILEPEGHDITLAEHGEEALELLKDDNPDLILLDVMMPGIDGLEVCKRIKSDPELSHIPVILVTVLNNKEDKLKGIEAGANEFLTKPISSKNVILRSRNLIYSHKLYERVVQDYHKLKDLQELQNNLVHMIVHDMKSLLAGIRTGARIIKNKIGENINTTVTKMLNRIEKSTNRLISMVESMLDVNKFESNNMELNKQNANIVSIIQQSLNSISSFEARQNIVIHDATNHIEKCFDPEVIRRVIDNLLSNALYFTSSDGEIDIYIKRHNHNIKVSVEDDGPGVPEEYQEKIFEKFGQVKARLNGERYSIGLGLTFCKLAVEAHGGEIGVESEEGKGSRFWFLI